MGSCIRDRGRAFDKSLEVGRQSECSFQDQPFTAEFLDAGLDEKWDPSREEARTTYCSGTVHLHLCDYPISKDAILVTCKGSLDLHDHCMSEVTVAGFKKASLAPGDTASCECCCYGGSSSFP